MAKDIYILNNGDSGVEDNRLDFQHAVFLGYTETLLPAELSAHLAQTPIPKIADIGVGTGVWLKALSKELPDAATLDGYDFDTSKFAHPETLPSNLRLQFGNIKEPFAESLHGKYDLIHIRLLFYAMKADEWMAAARNVMTLLKPGGYIFWEELSYSMYLVLPPSKAWFEYIDVDSRAGLAIGRDVWHNFHLRGYIRDAGFVGCEERSFQSITQRNPALDEGVKVALKNIARQSLNGLVEGGGFDTMQRKEDVDKLLDRIAYDFDHGHQVSCGMTWVWGEKPTHD